MNAREKKTPLEIYFMPYATRTFAAFFFLRHAAQSSSSTKRHLCCLFFFPVQIIRASKSHVLNFISVIPRIVILG